MASATPTRERRADRPARLKARIRRGGDGDHHAIRPWASEPPPPASQTAEVCDNLACSWIGRVSGAIVFGVSSAVLTGWLFGIEGLIRPIHGDATMRANTALALWLTGAAILALESVKPPTAASPRLRRNAVCVNAAGTLACAAAAIGALTLVQYAFGADLGIDELLVSDRGNFKNVSDPGRPTMITATMMVATGSAIALTAWSRSRALQLRLLSAVFALSIAYVALLSHAYEAGVLFKVHDRGATALATAACFFFAALAVLCLNAVVGWMRVISGAGIGSGVVRRLLPLVLFGIPILGFMRMAGEHAELYDDRYGAALFAVTVSTLIAGAVLWVGAQLNRQEERRILSEAQRGRTEALLDSLVANSQSMIAIHDSEGRIVMVNEAVERWSGFPREALIGRFVAEFRPPSDTREFNELLTTVLESGVAIERENFIGEGADRRCFLMQAFPVKSADNSFSGMGVITTDVTSGKEQEMLTRQLNADLVRETERAHEAIAELEAFAHTVSHDLRSPLRAIDGFSRIVQSEYAGALDDRGRRYLDLVIRGVGEMGELIDGLLEFSRLGRAEPELATVDLAAVAREANERLATEREGRAVQLSIGDLPPARADRRLMGVVFANLLSNAYKYTRNRDLATIQIGAVEAEPGRPVTYFVRDNGTGFDMRYAEKLFGVFERLHRSEDYEGSGVGLATVQRIIRRHGGCVWAQSEPGKGTTIFFQLSREASADG